MTDRIVIAEDEPEIRANLARILTLEGFDVWVGENGQEALDLIRQHRPDLVLTDVMMPVMDGYELLQKIRKDPETAYIPVVMLTAKADRSDLRQGMNLGADDYIIKPFQRDELLECIKAQFEKVAVQRAAARSLAQQQHRTNHYDLVTSLPNRQHLQLLLDHNLSLAEAEKLILVAINVDSLAQLGLVVSAADVDAMVQELAGRIIAAAADHPAFGGSMVVLSRVDHERFALLVPTWPDELDPMQFGIDLVEDLTRPVEVGGAEQFPVVSVGIVQAATDDRSETLLARVDGTLRAARLSSHRVSVSQGGSSGNADDVQLLNYLHRAVERGEIEVFFQPQVRTNDRTLVGFEALSRWRHPEHGLISPVQFIPLAEDSGLIIPIGTYILKESCRLTAEWRRSLPGHPAIRVAVNLSPRQFTDPNLVQLVADTLAETGLAHELLELEITEGTAMVDLQHTLQTCRQLKELGVALAIDDFGTGYSSLAYLKRFPLDVLKIDQSFVRNLTDDTEDQAIVSTLITLAHALGLHTIAEGVETEAQHALLERMGADIIQGYLHGRPMPAPDVPGWLASR